MSNGKISIVSIITAFVLIASFAAALIPQAISPQPAQAQTTIEVVKVFDTAGSHTWAAPPGVSSVKVEAWGGGGSGGGSTNLFLSARGGAGGGGGAYASSTLPITQGQTLQVVVAGQTNGLSGQTGNSGSPSFVGPDTNPANALVRAAGGSGGTGNTAGGSPAGGAGGTVASSVGETRIAGTAGGAGATGWFVNSGAGGAGANGGGAGGASVTSGTSNGNPGTAPGGGGSGARTSSTGGARAGGTGAAGQVRITYTYEVTIEIYDTAGSWTFTPPAGVTEVEYLVVGGGGGGGGIDSGPVAGGGGGGAGGFRTGTHSVNPLENYTVTVGAGGSPGVHGIKGGSGEDSSFATITAAGGGGGASSPEPNNSGVAGGSGGGGRWNSTGLGGDGNTPATSPSQGNGGGTGSSSNFNAGGGGGASAAGFNGASNRGGDGGSGTASSISGISITYAGGGGGGGYGDPGGSGGAGGGGSAPSSRGAGSPGTNGLGGGGGGATGSSSGGAFSGGGGGSGIVIIRYSLTTTTTSLASSANPSEYGEPVTFTATVSPATAVGTVQFKIDGNDFGSPVTLSGGIAVSGAISSLSSGDHIITAVYSGGGNHSPSQDEITQTVNPPETSIEITAPGEISDWVLSPAGSGENTRTGQLIINVTPDGASWSVTAQDLDGATGGYMTQWDGANYGSAQLANPLRVQGHSEISLPAGGVIASGTGDATVTVTFKQTVEWADAPDDYRIMVTFIGAID